MSEEYLKDHASAIGNVCIQWGGLERVFESLAAALLGLKVASPEIHVIAANTDMRGLIGICSALSANKAPSKKWKAALDDEIKLVDDDLRLKRNRVVHDLWIRDGDIVRRLHIRAKVAKPRSFAPKQLTTFEDVNQTAKEIETLAETIYAVSLRLLALGSELPGWPEDMAE